MMASLSEMMGNLRKADLCKIEPQELSEKDMAERKFGFIIKIDEDAIKKIIDETCVNVFGDKPARYTEELREQINLLICERLK
jgi:hypothetical protein